MEIEYRDSPRRGKYLVAIGIVLALIAGGGAFLIITQAQQQAGQAGLQTSAIVVAATGHPRPQGDRPRGPRSPPAPDERHDRPGRVRGPVEARRAGRRHDDPQGPAGLREHARRRARRGRSSRSSGRARRSAQTPRVARGLDHRARRPRGRWPAAARGLGRRLRDLDGDGAGGGGCGRKVLHRQVHQDRLPGHADPGQDRDRLRPQGFGPGRRGDLASPGQRGRRLQLRPPARTGSAGGRHGAARHDDNEDRCALRPPPAGVVRTGPGARCRARSRRPSRAASPTPAASPSPTPSPSP